MCGRLLSGCTVDTELIQQPLPPSPFPPPSSAPLFLSQGTSVVSPIITPVILISIMVLYATNSPARLLHTNCVVFFTAFYFPMSKMVIYMMVIESSLHLRIWLQQPLLPLSLLLPFLLLPSPSLSLLSSLPVIWYDQEPLPPPGPYHARPTTGLPQHLLRNTSTRALNCDCCCGEGDMIAYWCVRQLSEAY